MDTEEDACIPNQALNGESGIAQMKSVIQHLQEDITHLREEKESERRVIQFLHEEIEQMQLDKEYVASENARQLSVVHDELAMAQDDSRDEFLNLEAILEERDAQIDELFEENQLLQISCRRKAASVQSWEEEAEGLECNLTNLKDLLAEKDLSLSQALEEKRRLLKKHTQIVKIRDQFDAELSLERERSKKL
ncbi:hypothetical protein DFS34DRAFT_166005 [Phlyctochytrium arcticum]|nr:hypothetical protein DFS34DRAFT_166005 [Phlyctochytrium arcticum]